MTVFAIYAHQSVVDLNCPGSTRNKAPFWNNICRLDFGFYYVSLPLKFVVLIHLSLSVSLFLCHCVSCVWRISFMTKCSLHSKRCLVSCATHFWDAHNCYGVEYMLIRNSIFLFLVLHFLCGRLKQKRTHIKK